jgi:hypothetical protein
MLWMLSTNGRESQYPPQLQTTFDRYPGSVDHATASHSGVFVINTELWTWSSTAPTIDREQDS